MDNEKLFDEKLKKRIKDENVIVPPELNEKLMARYIIFR